MIRRLKLLQGDRRRRQRGSVLSGLLIIVAFLSILIGALMTELTTSFLISRTHTARVAREATATSAMELAINRFQTRMVPTRCVTDRPNLVPLTLNGSSAAGTSSCTAIVPVWANLTGGAGAFTVDGTHELVRGRNSYLAGDQAGNLSSYPFGTTIAVWSIWTGGALTAPPLAKPDLVESTAVSLLVPSAKPGPECGGHCVELFQDEGGIPWLVCAMPAGNPVIARPAVQRGGPGGFPNYTFFGDAGGFLYVYDATEDGGCIRRQARGGLGGSVVGDPLVFPGAVTSSSGGTTVSADVFVVVTGAGSTQLVHWLYSEITDSRGSTTTSLGPAEQPLPIAAGGNATGYAISSTAGGPPLTLAVAGATGTVAMATISVGSGPTYPRSAGPTATLPGGIGRAPYWCHCPGQDLIGVGSTNGTLYVLDTGLNLRWSYSGVADGSPAINTTPAADANGNWYFGANDGYVYNVEPPPSGQQMVKAARIFAGGAISSSPVVGSELDGCVRDPRLDGHTPCLYFASSTSGVWFAKVGSTRVLDVRVSCVTVVSDPATCVNPRLWALIEVGYGVKVRGWSYYAP